MIGGWEVNSFELYRISDLKGYMNYWVSNKMTQDWNNCSATTRRKVDSNDGTAWIIVKERRNKQPNLNNAGNLLNKNGDIFEMNYN